MTKEENIATLNEHLEHWKRLLSEKICDQIEGKKTIDALQNAIKVLYQEQCGDCISREEVSKLLNEGWWKGIYPREAIMALPSVIPMPKMGRWKRISRDLYVQHAMAYYECSECGKKMIGTHNYCPNCGCTMQEVEG